MVVKKIYMVTELEDPIVVSIDNTEVEFQDGKEKVIRIIIGKRGHNPDRDVVLTRDSYLTIS